MLGQASIDPITEPNLFYSAVLLAAWRGDAPRARELIEKMVPSASSRVRTSLRCASERRHHPRLTSVPATRETGVITSCLMRMQSPAVYRPPR